jgi:integrase
MIALSPSTVLVLNEHKEKQKLERAMLGIPLEDDDLVFSQTDGKPLLPDTISHAWVRLIKRIGLEGIRLHNARHSHASLLLKQGVHSKVFLERLPPSQQHLTFTAVFPLDFRRQQRSILMN